MKLSQIMQDGEIETGEVRMPYRVRIPAEKRAPYRVLLYLHGAGERGCDNTSQVDVNDELLVRILSDEACDDVLVIAPQCPADRRWVAYDWRAGCYTFAEQPESAQMRAVFCLLDEIFAQYPVRRESVYAAGISMGGYGVWDAIARRPDLFAAAVVAPGGPAPDALPMYARTPVWAFHNTGDAIIPVEPTRALMQELTAANPQSRYTEYEVDAHNCWTDAFAAPALLDWLFSHTKAAT